MSDEVLYEKFDGYAIFTLNRPEVLNAMNTALRIQFTDYLDDVSTTYVDQAVLAAARGPKAVEMAYRGGELVAIDEEEVFAELGN